eukprot:m.52850 g.52850  ORF g.52850 m.52850 type:complete len:1096 (-) comp21666_c0_seq1:356-3643(-)
MVVKVVALAVCVLLFSPTTFATLSANNCECASSCDAKLQLDFGGVSIALGDSKCIIDSSSCGICPQQKCVDGYRFCVPFTKVCTDCHKGTTVCYDDCTQPDVISIFSKNDILAFVESTIEKFDDLTDLTKKLVEDGVQSLSPDLRYALETGNASQFAKLGFEELAKIPQDVLARAKNVQVLIAPVIKSLVNRLVTFTEENLESFLDLLNPEEFKQSLKDFGCISDWSDEQVKVLAKKAGSVLGSITGWTVQDVREIGSLIRGVAGGNFSQMRPLVFKTSVLALSISGVPRNTSEKIVSKTVEVFDSVSSWPPSTWRKVGRIAEALVEGDLATVKQEAIPELARLHNWDPSQVTTIANRIIEISGGLADGDITEADLQSLALFAKNVSLPLLRTLGNNTIYALGRGTCKITGVCLNESQAKEIAAAAKANFADVKDWGTQEWRALGQNIRALNVTELREKASVFALPAIKDMLNVDPQSLTIEMRTIFAEVAVKAQNVSYTSGWSDLFLDEIEPLLPYLEPEVLRNTTWTVLERLSNAAKAQNVTLSAEQTSKAFERAKQIVGQVSTWNVTSVPVLASLVDGITLSDLEQLRDDVLVELAKQSMVITNATTLASITKLVQKRLGDPVVTEWTEARWKELGPVAIKIIMNATVLQNIVANDAKLLQISNLTGFSPAELHRVRDAIKTAAGDVESIDWSKVGNLVTAFTAGDLRQLSDEALLNISKVVPQTCPSAVVCDVASSKAIGDVTFCPAQIEALAGRAVHYLGNVSNWSVQNFSNIGFLVQGLSEYEIGVIPDEAFDVVANITCWNKDQLKCLANRAMQIYQTGENFANWTSATWVKIDKVSTGISADQLQSLTRDTFQTAQSTLAKQLWNKQQLDVLAEKLKNATGMDVASWTKDQVVQAGTILSGLEDSDLRALSPLAIKMAFKTAQDDQDDANAASPMVNDTAPLIQSMCSNEQLHTLTPDQLGNITEAGVMLNQTCPAEMTRLSASQHEAVVSAVVCSSPCSQTTSDGGISAGVVVAIVFCVLLIVVVAAVLVVWTLKRRQASTSSATTATRATTNDYKLEAQPPTPAYAPTTMNRTYGVDHDESISGI